MRFYALVLVAAPCRSGMVGVSGDKSYHGWSLSSAQVPAANPKIVSARGSLPLTQRGLCGGLREVGGIEMAENISAASD